MYTEQEIQEIQKAITKDRRLTEEETELLVTDFNNNVPGYIILFAKSFLNLRKDNPELYRKVIDDEKIQSYSLLGFFPETFDLVYNNGNIGPYPKLGIAQGNRWFAALLIHPEKDIVIKPLQSDNEKEIANIASQLDIGPKQYRTLEGFLTEEFVKGTSFPNLVNGELSPDNMYKTGRNLGNVLRSLHSKEIYYNDVILTDDFGKSHLIVQQNDKIKLIDYGVAIQTDKHPNYTDEEIFNFARTLPMIAFFHGSQCTSEEKNRLIDQFRPMMQESTKEEIKSRDYNFVLEGLSLAEIRFNKRISEPLLKGFNETYS